ncbi:MAG: glycosyltransferase family 2 protein [Rikenellaceae bacterium]|nr:glycosyltransferase family 2 protein [Bacteroidales bacterium]MDI9516275.1 glycosyltransferase family 2 protein [Bacteroidota bacterium]NLH55871.1 glycosyltransferase family 2 protein [Rikenellaceae bacterium]OQC64977.1 MAG: hypothetical protein BWX49_00348 [Bacteroidetes bacterium ADurb.Bin008]HOF90493.1 glycosyltransferase family 2 protein [Tenuifilaceae bacterium]
MNFPEINMSVVIPVYYDQDVLPKLYDRLIPVMEKISTQFEIILIDDGSKDNSFNVIKQLKKKDDRIVAVRLTRNFGQANAITAGLDLAQYEYITIMDSDLQDPPEFIEDLLKACMESDTDMAIARRKTRKDTWIKRTVSKFFNKLTYYATTIKIEQGLGVFRVLKREAYLKIKNVPEITGTTLSLLYWGGFDYVAIDMDRDKRQAGSSGYTLRKMFKLALDRIFSYSLWPLRIATLIGFVMAGFSFIWALLILIKRIFFTISVAGWTTNIVLILLLFGINYIIMGIIGEYVGRIYMETKQRPKYIIGKIYR